MASLNQLLGQVQADGRVACQRKKWQASLSPQNSGGAVKWGLGGNIWHRCHWCRMRVWSGGTLRTSTLGVGDKDLGGLHINCASLHHVIEGVRIMYD